MKKRLCDFKYTEVEARMIISTPRAQLAEVYREVSAAIELYQASHAELTDEYLVLLLQGEDPEGIMPQDRKKVPETPTARGLTDYELQKAWESLDVPIKSIGSMYLGPGVIRSHDKVVVEAVAYLLSEITALRQEPSLTPSGLYSSHERAKMLLQKGVNSLKAYLTSGFYCIDPSEPHWSEGGGSFWDTRYLKEEDKTELLEIKDARARARYEGISEHTRIPLPPQDGSLVDTGDRRCLFGQCEIRAVGDGTRHEGRKRIEAHVPYNSPSAVLHSNRHGPFVEVLMPGCFTYALSQGNTIKALFNHDSSKPLGSTKNRTLIIEERETGLFYTIFPNMKTSYGQDAFESTRRGEIEGTSFQFQVEADGERFPEGVKISGHKVREVHHVRLLTELSPCTFPAYPHSKAIAAGEE